MTVTWFAYSGDQVLAEYEDSGALDAFQPSRKFVYGSYVDEPLMMLSCSELAGGGRTETAYYYHQDRNFNVIALTDDTGQVVDRYSYSAYGEIETLTNGGTKITANPYFFTGRRFDAELRIYYYRARYHDPALGRFLSRDPLEYVDGMSLYEYVKGMPLALQDPSGNGVGERLRNLFAGAEPGNGADVKTPENLQIVTDEEKWNDSKERIKQGAEGIGQIAGGVGAYGAILVIGGVAVAEPSPFAEVAAGAVVPGLVAGGSYKFGVGLANLTTAILGDKEQMENVENIPQSLLGVAGHIVGGEAGQHAGDLTDALVGIAINPLDSKFDHIIYLGDAVTTKEELEDLIELLRNKNDEKRIIDCGEID